MNSHQQQSPRYNATGLATGSILTLIVAMAVSLVLDIPPAEARTAAELAQTSVTLPG